MPDVIRAEDFYTPPPAVPGRAWDRLPAAERCATWYEHKAGRRLRRPDADAAAGGPPLWARIDAGRWVAQCPCGSAQVVSPADPRMWCVECQPAAWRTLRFPDDPEAAERVVADVSPPRRRFWWQPDDPARRAGQEV